MLPLSVFDFESFPQYTKDVTVIVYSLFIGVVIAALLSLYYKHVLGSFVRYLIKSGADSPDNAIRLDTTTFKNNFFVKSAIKNGHAYKSFLNFTGGDEIPAASRGAVRRRAEEKALLSRAYYIPQELSFRAENLYSKKGTNAVSALLGILLFVLVAAASLVIIPDLMTMLQNFINGLA